MVPIAMRSPLSTVFLLCVCGTATTALATQVPAPGVERSAVAAVAPATDDKHEAIDGAVAGALVGALTEQFGGRNVSIRLDKVDVQPSSIRDRIVSGAGRVRIGSDRGWIGFRFSTLYDTVLDSAAWPDISLGGVTDGERQVPNDTVLIRQLDSTVAGRLGEEFSSQPVRLQLDRITTVEAGTRYLRINASGIADFGLDGTSPTRIEALYDLRDSTWLRIDYELGPAPGRDNHAIFAGG